MEKTLIVLACLCGLAFAQLTSRTGTYSRFQQQPQQRQPLEQQQLQEAPRVQSGCNQLNERYPAPGSCDKYVECINGTAEEKLCPDGLRFNPNLNFSAYPCQYPNEYSCLERSASLPRWDGNPTRPEIDKLQYLYALSKAQRSQDFSAPWKARKEPAQPTSQCPNQFGYFKIGDERNCSYFRNCVNGVGYDIQCPEGLAWSSQSYRCEWPDEVEDCDAEAFLGFRCPEVPQSKDFGPPAGYRFYRAENNCQKYFLCIENRPRVLFCGSNTAFDELTSTCVSADEVSACPVELRERAANAREDEKQLLAKELEFSQRKLVKSRRPAY